MKLGVVVEDALDDAGDHELSADLIDEIAEDEGVAASHLYAAVAMTTDLRFSRTEDVSFVVCAGGCQGWGSLDILDELVRIRAERVEGGHSGFNICSRSCLDKCENAPVVMVDTPHGLAVLSKPTVGSLQDAVRQACGDG